MTQEDKDLLLKDLCGRLPYGVKVNNEIQGDFEVYGVCENCIFARTEACHVDFDIKKIKPYLFPLSILTDEQIFLSPFGYETMDTIRRNKDWTMIEICRDDYYELTDWFNKNHFDYRGLIEQGLAIDAAGKNIYWNYGEAETHTY